MTSALRALALLAAIAVAACSSDRSTFEVSADSGPPVVGPIADGSVDAPLSTGDCSDENKQIYVLTSGQRSLYRFDPADLQFTHIGDVVCPSTSNTFSMAVDRRGDAWVEFADGRLFRVSTKDAHCTELPFRAGQTGFTNFGMGFSKDASGDGETLYVAGQALGKIDTTSYELSLIGQTSGLGIAELTGTGNGLLYAFAVDSGRVVQLDKTTGSILKTYRTAAVVDNASWAFAQWGGDFWLFTGQSSSSVTRYSPTTDTSTVVVADTGLLIVGAGSSTCAPVSPPR